MSSIGNREGCDCKPESGNLRVMHRQHNHSAFNGYHWTPSDYSTVACTVHHRVWRTKAGYVNILKGDCERYKI
jgi:hypothetical protein